MPSGRSSDRERRRRRSEGSTARRPERARRGASSATSGSGRRPGGQAAARPRPKPSTGGAFQLSSTRRASVLAILVCAMVLSVSVPLRTYLSQGDELAAKHHEQTELDRRVKELEHRKAVLSDPARVEAEARERLGYVRPGETPYIVQVPIVPPAPPPAPPSSGADGKPWYEQMWKSLTGKGA